MVDGHPRGKKKLRKGNRRLVSIKTLEMGREGQKKLGVQKEEESIISATHPQ